MPISFFAEMSSLAVIAGLGLYTCLEDIRHTEIPAIAVIAMTLLAVAHGAVFPLEGLSFSKSLAAALLAGCLGIATRLYARWRTGVSAFGAADILALIGGGAMLGLNMIGPLIVVSVVLAIALGQILPRLFWLRDMITGSETVQIIPFCPALILSWVGFYAAARSGLIPANFLS